MIHFTRIPHLRFWFSRWFTLLLQTEQQSPPWSGLPQVTTDPSSLIAAKACFVAKSLITTSQGGAGSNKHVYLQILTAWWRSNYQVASQLEKTCSFSNDGASTRLPGITPLPWSWSWTIELSQNPLPQVITLSWENANIKEMRKDMTVITTETYSCLHTIIMIQFNYHTSYMNISHINWMIYIHWFVGLVHV